MSEWAAKRFWTAVDVVPAAEGYGVRLDERPLTTPRKAPLVVPTRELGEAVAAEWEAQEGRIRPETMPMTRAANTAIDNVAQNRTEVAAIIAQYGESDLLCYRAPHPPGLRAREAAAWDPLLDWAAAALAARLVAVEGVSFVPQPEDSLAALRERVGRFDPFGLTGLHDLVALSGSLVIGLAAAERARPLETLWEAACVDENWQIEHWGRDCEAEAHSAQRRQAFFDAARFLAMSGGAVQGNPVS